VHLANEVHVTAWINTDHNYQLTKTRKGTDTVRRMFVLFGPGDTPETKIARGIVVLHPDEVDAFLAQVLTGADLSDPRLPFVLLGRRASAPDLPDMVQDAFQERGLTKDADFLVIDPYLEGRAAALAPDPEAPMRAATLFGGFGAVFALFALGKLLAGRQRQAVAPRSLADVVIPPPPPGMVLRPQQATEARAGLGYATLPTPQTSAGWSPLAAVLAKQAADPTAAQGRAGYIAPAARIDTARNMAVGIDATNSLPRKGFGKLKALAIGAVLYAAIYLSFGTGNGPLSTATMQQLTATMQAALGQTDMASVEIPDATSNWGPEAAPEGGALEAAKRWVMSVAAKAMTEPSDTNADADRVFDLPQASLEPETQKDQVTKDIEAGKTPAEAIAAAIRADSAATRPVFNPPNWQRPADDSGLFSQAQAFLNDVISRAANIQTLAAALALFGVAMALFAALAVARRTRQKVVVTRRDPWDRISERLQ
jgi:hypothetical protein